MMRASKTEKKQGRARRVLAGCLGSVLLFSSAASLSAEAVMPRAENAGWVTLKIKAESQEEESNKKQFITIIDNILTSMDADYAIYRKAYQAMEDYYNGKSSLKDTRAIVVNVQSELKQRLNTARDVVLSYSEKKIAETEATLAEVTAFGQTRRQELEMYVGTAGNAGNLETMMAVLDYVGEYDADSLSTAVFREYWQRMRELTLLFQKFDYYHYLNYWFANWTDEDAKKARDSLLPHLKNLFPKEYTWEKSKDGAEAKAEAFLDEIEQIETEMAGSLRVAEFDLSD